ncbi:uncharacterized protein ACRADG_011289 [Cochliomyia hominivorax]
MHLIEKLKIVILLIMCFSWQIVDSKKSWTYEFTDIKTTTTNADLFEAELEIVRVARGIFGFSGYVNIKEDLDDSVIVEANFYRDKYCDEDYEIQPYSVSNTSLTSAMNDFYKPYVMDGLEECATDAPFFEEFVAPLTKRCLVMNECKMSNENLPSHMDDGCYLVSINLYAQTAVATINVYAVVEKEL